MDSDQGKLFIGGISWETTEDTLRDYFKHYGEVVDSVIMRDRNTGTARGFGFVVFADPNVADRVLLEKHVIAGRAVEAKKAVPRSEQQQGGSGPRVFNKNGSPQGLAGGQARTKKIFVGGLPPTLSEEDFRQYFQQFGNITDVVVMYDNGTQRPRGFGFITFDSEEAVENVLRKSFHELHEKLVEVKRAVPKEANMGVSRGRGFGAPAGVYGSNPGAGRYGGAPPPSAGRGGGGGYAGGYGPTGYVGTPGGYAPGAPGGYMNGGYGGGAGYGSPGGGYGMGGYVGVPTPPLGGGYGGGPAPPQVAGYGNAPAAAPQSPWGGATAGVGGAGVNSAGYGPKGLMGAGSGGQSPSGVPGYGNGPAAAYPYGDGGYNSGAPGGYGAGYGVAAAPYKMGMGGGYGDPHGAPGGYPDTAWKTGGGVDTSGGAPAGGYGVGGGGAPHADGMMNDHSGFGGGNYGAAGRQGQRGPDGRFRPYPERTG